MPHRPQPHDPAASSPPLRDEADIGSGEKTPAQRETERLIEDIPALPSSDGAGANDANGGNGSDAADPAAGAAPPAAAPAPAPAPAPATPGSPKAR